MAKESLRMRVNTQLGGLGVLKAGTLLNEEQVATLGKAGVDDLLKNKLAEKHFQPEPTPATITGTLTGGTDQNGDVVPLDKMKVDELKELAKELDIEGYANMTKPELIKAIEAQEVGFEDEGQGNA